MRIQTEKSGTWVLSPLRVRRLLALFEIAKEAADWMCEAHEGSDQYERGMKLREAVEDFQ